MKIELTKAEINALCLAAGNVMEWPDAVSSIFENSRQRKTAYTAYLKLIKASNIKTGLNTNYDYK